LIVATTENIAAHEVIETKGQVFGLIVRSRGLAGPHHRIGPSASARATAWRIHQVA